MGQCRFISISHSRVVDLLAGFCTGMAFLQRAQHTMLDLAIGVLYRRQRPTEKLPFDLRGSSMTPLTEEKWCARKKSGLMYPCISTIPSTSAPMKIPGLASYIVQVSSHHSMQIAMQYRGAAASNRQVDLIKSGLDR